MSSFSQVYLSSLIRCSTLQICWKKHASCQAFFFLARHGADCRVQEVSHVTLFTAHDNEGLEASQDMSSSPDRAFPAAWAKVYGTSSTGPVAARLATDWSTQHASSQGNIQAVRSSPVGSSHQHIEASMPNVADSPADAQAEPHSTDLLTAQAGGSDHQSGLDAQGAYADPMADHNPQGAEHAELGAVQQQHTVSTGQAKGFQLPADVRPNRAPQPPEQDQVEVVTARPSPAAQTHAKQQSGTGGAVTPLSARKAAMRASPGSPASGGMAALAPPAADTQEAHTQSDKHIADLDSRAMQLAMKVTCKEISWQGWCCDQLLLCCSLCSGGTKANVPYVTITALHLYKAMRCMGHSRIEQQRDWNTMQSNTAVCGVQRLVAREAQQQEADEAVLHSCPPSSLLQIPVWAHNLAPGGPHQLQGTLCVPAACSVRLLRRVFARAVQVSSLKARLQFWTV